LERPELVAAAVREMVNEWRQFSHGK